MAFIANVEVAELVIVTGMTALASLIITSSGEGVKVTEKVFAA
jgi:hypothetical protein